MNLILKKPKLTDLYAVANFRNSVPQALRTSGETTYKQQERFYENVICNDSNNHLYYGVYDGKQFVGLTGLTDINYINGNAEISLIIDPKLQRQGYGSMTVLRVLTHAFDTLRLNNIYGECYLCNPNLEFWLKTIKKYNGYKTTLPQRKFWDGTLWDSVYFNIGRDTWR